MKLLEFEVDHKQIKENLSELSDLNRHMIFHENEKLFNLLDYNNDDIFLEPSLFFYPVESKSYKTTSLEQLLFGYVEDKSKLSGITVISDSNGYINLPGFKYLKTEPNSKFYLEFNNDSIKLKDNNKNSIKYREIDFKYIPGTKIKLPIHQPELLENFIVTPFYEKIDKTLPDFEIKLLNSYKSIKSNTPILSELIELTNKEIIVFNSKMPPYSLAALFYFGAGLLNVNNVNHNEAFFIDDIAHQCGHTVFYALTLDQSKYLIPPPDTPLQNITGNKDESRDVYGSFHGLFTYTTILESINNELSNTNKTYEKVVLDELIARLGFYMNKFKRDLEVLNNKAILTKEGLVFWEMFKFSYEKIYMDYHSILKELDFSNQEYIFNFDLFSKVNTL